MVTHTQVLYQIIVTQGWGGEIFAKVMIMVALIVYARLGYMFSNYCNNYGIKALSEKISYVDVFALTFTGCIFLMIIGVLLIAAGALIYGVYELVQMIVKHYRKTRDQLMVKEAKAKRHAN